MSVVSDFPGNGRIAKIFLPHFGGGEVWYFPEGEAFKEADVPSPGAKALTPIVSSGEELSDIHKKLQKSTDIACLILKSVC